MANIVKDRVLEFTNVTGFDPIQLNGSPIGYRRFGDVLSDGDECYYTLVSESGDWETGISVYDANLNTLDRGAVTDNSVGSNAQIPFQAGSKKVFLTFTAQAYKDLVNKLNTLDDSLRQDLANSDKGAPIYGLIYSISVWNTLMKSVTLCLCTNYRKLRKCFVYGDSVASGNSVTIYRIESFVQF